MALLELSDSFTVGLPSALMALHTSENGAKESFGTSPRKSFVSNVPQPNETRTRPSNLDWSSEILATSNPSEKIINLSVGSSPRLFHHLIAISVPARRDHLSQSGYQSI